MIQLFPFISFQQIPDHFFDQKYNNPEKHDIENLYMKYNSEVGSVQYFYKINYKPIFKFNSVTAEISDSSARSFPVLCDISYLIQLPMWLFDTYIEPKVSRINLGLNANDSISSIVADNNFLFTDENTFNINDIDYVIGERFIVDPTSPNFKGDKIVLPFPKEKISNSAAESDINKDEDVTIQIAKLYPKESTVISWLGSHKSLPKEIKKDNLRYWMGFKDLKTNILNKNDYDIIKNEKTGIKEIILPILDNPNLKPDLDSPIIVSYLKPVLIKEKEKNKEKKNMFDKVYIVKDQKCWSYK